MNISKLVDKYSANRATYLKNSYNETQLRIDFLDPFFELLGWDIKNGSGKSTNEREVLVEEALKADASTNTKKPDYTFRLFAERKFFLEAKKPSVHVQNDDDAAKQVRRYGYTAKLKISVLSNFEHLIIYDCSKPVKAQDSVITARVKVYHYTEYEGAFEEIKAQLSHESVYNGAFDVTWKHIEDQLKRSSVDDLFLTQINSWRLSLGREIHSSSPGYDQDQLNDLVQRYINSLIFLRVCEDRQLEVYKTLLKCAEDDDYASLVKAFKNADNKYNAGLFDHPFAEKVIANSKSAFWQIIKELYYPESPYSFSVFASDILGNIYEIFLSEQLQIENGVVSLEKKPEHVDRDIVTTPTFIIQDLLRETIIKHCEGKSDKEILSSSFADIACGSGAFLLETYQLLNDLLIDFYLQNSPETLVQTSIDNYKLPFQLKKLILKSCIFGVDKDYNAVEACKFGLLLKLLENENLGSISTPALPNLDANIQFGNSLIEPEMTNIKDASSINPFDFGLQKFDAIIGNPPYMATKHMREFTPLEFPIYKSSFTSSFKQFDKYFLFIERGLSLLKQGGYFGYIVPNKFSKVGAGKALRKLLTDKRAVSKIVSFGANQVFREKSTYTCLLILRNEPVDVVEYLEVQNLADWKARKISPGEFDQIDTDDLPNDRWILVPGSLRKAYKAICSQSKSLENLVGSDSIYNGIQTSANITYIHAAKADDGTYISFKKDGLNWKVEKALTRPYYKTSKGEDNLNTYRPFSPNSFVIYPYLKSDDGINFVNIEKLESQYPYTYKYLVHFRDKLDNRTRDIQPAPLTADEWYRYGRHQSLDKCDVPAKIIVGILSQGNKYAIDYHGTLISSGGTAGYCMITLPDDTPYSIYYIQALLSSKYLEWFSALLGEVFRGGYIARGTKVLKELPIRTIDFDDPAEKLKHDEIADIQRQLIELQREIDSNLGNQRKLTPLRRSFDQSMQKLNDALRALYALDDDTIIPLISKTYAVN